MYNDSYVIIKKRQKSEMNWFVKGSQTGHFWGNNSVDRANRDE